ncbi:hypothetical protein [Streptomyces sp. NPDC060322]|uniref:hypothetical protein n=1 Tax=Streptomyces sp. NPDC060322 TaxID=3347097 RepID=UPI0036684145
MPDATPHSGTISDLDKNRALLDWLHWQAGQAGRRVRKLEIQEAQERERRDRARAEMSWEIQPQRPPRRPCCTGEGAPPIRTRWG